ncbi:rab-GTPase-TBC domain-containing protein [Radiomyces spectabilis]|uniref:rab-GTPase-TBC domain-containing protein n=1 Tax=Radiomyces spectabilis TaxID=64574 RepID=UPI00221F4329|nr:rab-GTPase-TBC domain-containing protein [Radiomyces spectabilis]KAI8394109.1 rab-GTPase-TBC domain-containing protein [Radiomyces spectabilis]
MLSRPPSVIAPLTVSQEALLAEMEQLNSANTNDPKAKVLLHIKRQSMRRSIMVGNPLERKDENMMTDDYDWELWASIICEQDLTKPIKLLPKHVQRGVPPALRGMVWQLLAQSKNANLEREYSQLLKLTSPYEKMIQRDLARTFPGHEVFKDKDGIGQEGLFNVMRAYSVFDQEVGYCQGLAFVVGPLLLNMPDEEAFCVFVQMMNKYGFRGHFTPDMEGLHLRLYQFDALLAEHLPHVARHLQLQGVRSTMYASQWFMTLFAYKFPLELVFLIYDVILAEGASAIFKFAIALLKRNETTILGLDFEQLLDFLKNKLFEEYKSNDRRLVDDACALQISPKRLFQLEKEHKQQLAKELADAKLLDELQQTNIAFKKKAKDLEFEVAELRREHQDVSEQLIESKDNLIHLYDERDSLQDLVDSLQAEVTGLPSQVEQQRRSQFDELCNENSQLVHKNCLLEDQLASIEALLIDMKMKYAQSENQKEELQRTLFEIKRSITT